MNDELRKQHLSGEQLPPPSERIPLLRWLRQNLFSSWFNAILTVVAVAVIVTVVFGLLR